jgi:methionyl-tRNA synthetase
MTQYPRHLITSALPYGNGPIHIGQLAGAYLPADIYVRYLRAKNEDVIFICGGDEHGVPITLQARKEGVHPQAVVDKYYEVNKQSFASFGIDFDIFHRTSASLHHETAQEFFRHLYDKGILFEETAEQYFDSEAQQFLADRYIIGTCPKCGFEEAYGDQCERCGSSLSPDELINPKSTLSGNDPELKETKHWYLPLDQYEDWLRQWILDEHKDDWKTNVYGQCKSWLDQGLKARAITRDLEWGVSVPLEEASDKVLYVWFDAPIGYISATKALFQQKAEQDPDHYSAEDWQRYWSRSDTHLVHFIGKDNIVFHCIIFPAMLHSHDNYIVPDNVPANEFLNLEGQKLSTSRNWAVWLNEYLEDWPGKQDVLRYVLTANAPETKDNDFTWPDFQAKNNNELVGVLGNFINRVVVLTNKYFGGQVPAVEEKDTADQEVKDQISHFPGAIGEGLENYRQREALNEMMRLARLGNKYLTETEPWKLWKANRIARVKTIMNYSLQVVANLTTLAEPFIPDAMARTRQMLNVDFIPWDQIGNLELIPVGHQVNQAELLFEKISDERIQQQQAKLYAQSGQKAEESSGQEPEKATIGFEDFNKLDVRIVQVRDAEPVPKADKLLKLTIDTGSEERTVVAGLAKHYRPETLIGEKVAMILNLEPKQMKGVESQGMLLMAEDEAGSLSFLRPDGGTPLGAKIR